RLVEATEHRQRPASVHAKRDVPRSSCLLLLEPLEQLRDRGRAEVTTLGAGLKELVRQARLSSMEGGPLAGLQHPVLPGAEVLDLPERRVCDVRGEVFGGDLEQGERLLEARGQLIGCNRRPEEEADQARLYPPAQLAHLVAGCRGPLGEGIRVPERVVALARL